MRILDTDVCIEILRGNGDVSRRRATTRDEVATTWITASELYYGAARSIAPEANRSVVDDFLESLPVLDHTTAAARVFGEAKALLQRQGRGLADADLLIAAITLSRGAVLVTGNRRHFERIPGIALEDWIRA